MIIKFPKDDRYFCWTRHIKNKMLLYALSESRIKRVYKSPKRKEGGVAPNTTAVMSRNDRRTKKEEIWVMYQKMPRSIRVRMISAWRYPGISKSGKEIPIPQEISEELQDMECILKSDKFMLS